MIPISPSAAGTRPVLQLASSARLLIISQAPGKTVHETCIAWNDASGDRLRDWLRLDRSIFYDEARVAILPKVFVTRGLTGQKVINRLAWSVLRSGTRASSGTCPTSS